MAGFKRGDLILESKPFAYALAITEKGKRCDYCLQAKESLVACFQCGFCYYCNIDCQRDAWDFHKDECKCIQKVHPREPVPSLRLLAQVLLQIKKNGNHEPWEMAGDYKRSFKDLQSHVKEVNNDIRTLQQMIFLMGTLKEYVGPKFIPDAPEFSEIFGKMVVNTFTISDIEMQSIGSGLYLGASVFNHSCEPNAEVVFEGSTLIVRAVRDIPDKDLRNVYISYIDQMQFRKNRQEQLQEQYYFTCECERCCNPKSDELMMKYLVNEKTAKKVEKHSAEELVRIGEMKKGNPSDIFDIAMDDLSAQEGVLGDTHVCRAKMLEHVLDVCIVLKRWPEALASGLELIRPYRLYYSDYHPNLCVLLMKIGKIQLLLHQLEEAKKHLLMAEGAIRVSHGCDHSLYREAILLLLQCQQELNVV